MLILSLKTIAMLGERHWQSLCFVYHTFMVHLKNEGVTGRLILVGKGVDAGLFLFFGCRIFQLWKGNATIAITGREAQMNQGPPGDWAQHWSLPMICYENDT